MGRLSLCGFHAFALSLGKNEVGPGRVPPLLRTVAEASDQVKLSCEFYSAPV